jgi:hypothetical protein
MGQLSYMLSVVDRNVVYLCGAYLYFLIVDRKDFTFHVTRNF